MYNTRRAGYVGSSSSIFRAAVVAPVVAVIVIVIVVFIALGLTIMSSNGRDTVQAVAGAPGPAGPIGPPGVLNQSSFNQTVAVSILDVGDVVNFTKPTTVLDFFNGSGSIYFNQSAHCVEVVPRICTQEVSGTGGQTLTLGGPVVVSGNSSLTVNQLVLAPPPANVSIYYDPVTKMVIIQGALLNSSGGLSVPIIIDDVGYITDVGNTTLLIVGYNNLTLNGTNVNLDGLLTLVGAIISEVNFWNNVYLANGEAFYFGNKSSGNVSQFPSIRVELGNVTNLTIDGEADNVVLRSAGNITFDNAGGDAIQFFGDVTFADGTVVSNLPMTGQIVFPSNNASISANGACLTLKAPSICFNATNNFLMNLPVQFLQPILGPLTVNGSVNVLGTLNVNGLTITSLATTFLNASFATINIEHVTGLLWLQPGSSLHVSGAGGITTDPTSTNSFSGTTQFFGISASGTITCQQPFFDGANSGCTSVCLNHSVCSDTFSQLTVTNQLGVGGLIVGSSSTIPNSCCINSGPFYYIYQKWATNVTSLISDSPLLTYLFLPLSFNYSVITNLLSGQRYIMFGGGSNWTVMTTGNYFIGLSIQIDTVTNVDMTIFLMCGTNTVYASPTFIGLARTMPFPSPYNTVSNYFINHIFEAQLTATTVCIFQLGYTGNTNLQISPGNMIYLSIKMESEL